ncbi:HAD family hydrolase [Burkholderia plantarii]|uniref:Putative HAD family hydrolase n=1 Tax=Burkholderia plantarii TaxID=41899 RepID=A0A0B6RYV4_BURPL|nr:HAD family phosphatase [Burkholderia plantarii]AJK50537.1 putative HAD family hydrolase [Burkholderia plantarii]
MQDNPSVPAPAAASDPRPRRPAARAILWDMDGTLADSEPLHFASLLAALRHFGVTADATLQAPTCGMTGRASYDFCVERFGQAFDFATWSRVRSGTFAASLGRLRARRGALALCRAAARAGLRQAVVSNAGRGTLDAGVGALGLDAWLAVSICAHDVPAGKPAPDGYRLAAERLGVRPGEAVVVEDSRLGARAGVAAGMRVLVWLGVDDVANGFPPEAEILRTPNELADALGLVIDPLDPLDSFDSSDSPDRFRSRE